jgi:CHAT domain-containing protein
MSCEPVPAERIYRHILAYKGAATRLSENRLLRDQPELKELIDKLDATRQRLAQLAYTAPSAGQQDDWSRQLTRVREDKQFLESELARRSEPFRRQLERRDLAPADVARVLPPGVVLVDVFQFYDRPTGKTQNRNVGLVSPYAAQSRFAGPGGEIQFRHVACVSRNGRSLACIDWSADEGRRLRSLIADAQTVLVAPDGFLSKWSFAVQPGRKPGSYLIEDVAIGYVTSGRQVVEIFSDPVRNDGHGLLAIGGVDYTADPGTSTTRLLAQAGLPGLSAQDRAGFTFLAGTEVESRDCAELFRQVFPTEPVTLLTGAAAQEGRLKQELTRRYRYLHLATHGFFASPERINALRLKVPPPASKPAAATRAGQIPWAEDLALLESGVVLAGAGRDPQAGQTSQEDGILTAEEVAALDLRGTELVTLSACDTALGQIARGQGVLGLQQAFAAAGARTLVTTLWPVDDVTTVILMDEFYRNLWQKKLPKLEALRQAQLKVLKEPEFVRRRRQEVKAEFAKLGLKRDLELGGADPPANSVKEAPRTDPKLWGAFVLSGDIR